MRKLWIILAVCAVAGCGDGLSLICATDSQPQEIKTTNNPDEARIKALEARVELLESWAVKTGGRVK